MESTIAFYQQCVKTLLSHYESLHTQWSHVELLCDDERMRYMAIRVGWLKQKRIHLCLVHIDICDDTIMIQCNNTEDMVATELVDMGIPREKIDLGFVPPEARPYAEFHAGELPEISTIVDVDQVAHPRPPVPA